MSEKRVLVVDDDADLRGVVEKVLASAGYETLSAGSGGEGIERAVAARPDLVLLDVVLPDLSGWEVCATLRSLPETASIPVVLLTARTEIRDFLAGRQAGALDFVPKPFGKARLLEAVSGALAGRPDALPEPLVRELPEARSRSVLVDAITGLPTVPFVVDALREKLASGEEVGVLLVDVDAAPALEDHYGWEVLDEVVREASDGLRRLVGTLFATGDLLAVTRPGSSALVAFAGLAPGQGEGDAAASLERKARQVEESLGAALGERFLGRIHRRLDLTVGSARLRCGPQVRIERAVDRALVEAAAAVTGREEARAASQREAFESVLRTRDVETLFQPIVEIATGRAIGWEALSRGPRGSGFESPEVLYEYATRHGRLLALEELCVARTASRFPRRGGELLFVNVEAHVVNELPRGGLEILSALVPIGPSVVLEITERGAIPDFEAFRKGLAALRRAGFRIALDDAGTGHASLHALAELRPDFLKVSQSLVSGLPRDGIKEEIVRILVTLGARIGAVTIAEGIETEEELAAVRDLGVTLGQGLFLGPPGALPPA